jgi:hypothetical protein
MLLPATPTATAPKCLRPHAVGATVCSGDQAIEMRDDAMRQLLQMVRFGSFADVALLDFYFDSYPESGWRLRPNQHSINSLNEDYGILLKGYPIGVKPIQRVGTQGRSLTQKAAICTYLMSQTNDNFVVFKPPVIDNHVFHCSWTGSVK